MALIEQYLTGLHECLKELATHDIEVAAGVVFDAYRKGKRIFIMGNGGSATTAMHFARDLQIGTAVAGQPRVRATSLADNMAFVTSLGNDKGYDSIFVEQLVGQLTAGDVVIGISASGNSPNVLLAIEYARDHGAATIGLIGFGGGRLKTIVDKAIVLSSRSYQQVEDVHMVLAHIIPSRIKEKIEAL
jgi:D-sedoheptulose 7-phosphate isomerase